MKYMLAYYSLLKLGIVMTKNLLLFIKLIRLDKPVGIILLLWPTTWAIVTASDGNINYYLAAIFIAGVISTRSLGCAINDLADRKIDGKVKRTATRPLATGELKPRDALKVIFILSLTSLILLAYLPKQTWPIALIAALLMIIYPFCKRFLSCPQFILGLSFSTAILMVYSAVQNQISFQAWHLFIGSTLWSVIYDTQYALVDREYDLKLGVKSSAIWFGENIFTIIALLQISFISLWIYFGIISSYNIWYYSIICMIIITAYYQHNLVISDIPEKQFLAFKNNQWVGLIILLALYSQYL